MAEEDGKDQAQVWNAIIRLSQAIEAQTESVNALVAVVAEQFIDEEDDDPPVQTYMDGTPVN